MPLVQDVSVTLRFFGDELDPDWITHTLGVSPSHAHRKGDIIRSMHSKRTGVRRTGMWSLQAADRLPADLDGKISELLDQLPCDSEVWVKLAPYKPDISIGLFLNETNEEIGLSSATIQVLAARGIELDFDIYGPLGEPTPQPAGV